MKTGEKYTTGTRLIREHFLDKEYALVKLVFRLGGTNNDIAKAYGVNPGATSRLYSHLKKEK